MTAFRHIGIIIKQQDERLKSTLDSLLVQLRALDVELYLDETLQHAGFPLSRLVSRAEIASSRHSREENIMQCRIMIVTSSCMPSMMIIFA